MDYKLVGSRAAGTNRQDSDYDYMLNGVVGRCKEVDVWGCSVPSWKTAAMLVDIAAIKEKIKIEENLPVTAEIDLFGFITVDGREGQEFSVGLCNLKQNYCLTLGASTEEAEAKLVDALENEWEY